MSRDEARLTALIAHYERWVAALQARIADWKRERAEIKEEQS